MTARVTTLKGLGIAAYYLGKLGRYYSAPGEPPGRWQGRGAVLSGLDGDVDQAEFENVLAGFDPAGVLVRGTRFGDTHARAFDVTFSAPKSASVLWAVGPPAVQAQVIAAHEAAVAAVVAFIDSQAVTRRTTGGVTSVVDAQGISAAVFRQHTSRAGDPQLHSHVVVSSKVQDPTGKWLALDARSLKCDQRTLSSLFHATFRSEATARLGVRWLSPVNGIAEMATIDAKVLRAYSARTDQYERRLRVKLDRFAETMEREPTPRERWKLEREAAKDSRPRKATLASRPEDLHVAWRQRLVDLGHDHRRLTSQAIAKPAPRALTGAGVGAMVDQALAALSEGQSTWRRNELIRELAAAIPTTVAIPADQLPGWLGDLADHTIAHRLVELAPTPPPGVSLRVSDGRPVSESALDRLFTTDRILDEERQIEASAYRRFAIPGGPGNVNADGLDRAQLDVARAVAGTAQLVLVVGPAGTGKTTALRPGVAALQERWRKVIGLAPSATAAAVLKEETGLEYTDTIDAFLLRSKQYGRSNGGTTVIVDLCRHRDYAERRRRGPRRSRCWGASRRSPCRSGLHNHRASRKASSGSGGR